MRISIKLFLAFYILHFTFFISTASAVVDPFSATNNKFGIHIISPSPDESSPAASLVNTNGDWGYITVIIAQNDKKTDKWQEFFNDLRRRHLIPIVRLATETEGQNWKRPNPDDANSWADFLNSLNWPTKNRYVIIFNEPNHAREWGGMVDARSYAQILDKWIGTLKDRSEDFFVLNGGFDASAPNEPPNYADEVIFLRQMNKEIPGIFEKLDGWVSHSYPNPGFVGSPNGVGRGTVRGWFWELQQLRSLGVTKNLPVFITETGWKHAEGINYDYRLPTSDVVSKYFEQAFNGAWNNNRIVAVTPFLLNYQQVPFDHFSFQIPDSKEFYPQFDLLKNMPKNKGQPIQINSAKLLKGEVFSSIVAGETYTIFLAFKNNGQSIWNDRQQFSLQAIQGNTELGIQKVEIPERVTVAPGEDYTFQINLRAPQKGHFNISLQLFSGNKEFDSPPLQFTTEVKEPVILQVLAKLKWKESAAGKYLLRVSGAVGESTQAVRIDGNGQSQPLEARYLLPDYTFDFTLEKENYKSKTIQQSLKSGENVLDFGELQPQLLKNLLHPVQLWKLLPFSN